MALRLQVGARSLVAQENAEIMENATAEKYNVKEDSGANVTLGAACATRAPLTVAHVVVLPAERQAQRQPQTANAAGQQ